jgi:hypothetical protein
MGRGSLALGLALAALAGAMLGASPAQTRDVAGTSPAGTYHTPRNRIGQPIIEGAWTNLSLTDLERPDELKGLVPPPDQIATFEKVQNDPDALDAQDAEEAKKAGKPPPPNVGQNQADWSDADMKLARVRGLPRSSYLVDPPDGKLPYRKAVTDQLKAKNKASQEDFGNPESRPLGERCLSTAAAGPPLMNMGVNANIKIVQTRDHVAILSELIHDVRIIELVPAPASTGPDPRPPSSVPVWMGRSVGWWEGNTLQVRTTGFLTRVYPMHGVMLSDQAVVEEAFTRTAPDVLHYRFRVVDPVNYDRTWWGEMEFNAAPPKALLEYGCHEGNYALPGILAGARLAEAEAAKVKVAKPEASTPAS